MMSAPAIDSHWTDSYSDSESQIKRGELDDDVDDEYKRIVEGRPPKTNIIYEYTERADNIVDHFLHEFNLTQSSSSEKSVPESENHTMLRCMHPEALEDDSVSGSKRTHDMRIFRVESTPTHRMVKFKDATHKIIIDSGATHSGTGIEGQLDNVRPHSCTIEAAFGENVHPTKIGELPPFMLKTIVVEEMKDTTLLSVSQLCRQDMVGIFTAVDCRFYSLQSILPFISDISIHGEETMRGSVENGLYVQESS